MAGSFSAQVSAWVAETRARQDAVRKEAAQDVIEIMQTPGPSVANPSGGRGGNMPIDTGFLRASLTGVLGTALPPASLKPKGDGKFSYSGDQVNLTIAGSKLSDTITVAYTANYARFAEARYAFTRLAAQQWQQVVDRAALRARTRVQGPIAAATIQTGG